LTFQKKKKGRFDQMSKKVIRALVITDSSQIEKLPLVGNLPKSAKQPWVCVDVEHTATNKKWMVLYPQDLSIPKDYGINPDNVEVINDNVFEINGGLVKKLGERKAQNLAAVLPLTSIPIPIQIKTQTQVLVGFNSIDELASCVQQSLTLNNNVIQYASITKDNPLGKLVLKISKPSLFLLEKWVSEGKSVYVNGGTPQLWIALGWKHPWVSLFNKPGFLEKVDTSHLVLISQDKWNSMDNQVFNDVFESVKVSLDVSKDNLLVSTEQKPKFSVSMHWGIKVQPAQAELWLLNENEQGRLEDLLTVLSDSDLNNLQLAVVYNSDGDTWYIVREIISGKSKHFLNFGESFSPYGGYTNLLLPVNRSIEPPIRRDLLSSVFNLKNGELTLVLQQGSAMNLVRVKEYLFKPFNSLIDYIIQGNNQIIEQALKRSLFDDVELNRLPDRPIPKYVEQVVDQKEPKRRGRPSKNSKKQSDEDDGQDSSDYNGSEVVVESTKEVVVEIVEEIPESKEITPVQQTEEDVMESNAVDNISSYEIWFDLSKKKYTNRNFDQAISCLEHALWLNKDKSKDASLLNILCSWLEKRLSKDSSAVYKIRFDVLDFCKKYKANRLSGDEIGQKLPMLTETLRELNAHLSKKARWILWSNLLKLTDDQIELAHQREVILGELSLRGIENKDSFAFIRRHIRQQQKANQNLPHIQKWLMGLFGAIEKISDKNHQLELKGHVAIGVELTGDAEAAHSIMKTHAKALSGLSQGKGTLALAGFSTLAARLSLPETEKMYNDTLNQFSLMVEGYEKDLSLAPLLEYIQHASLLNVESELMRRLFDIMSKQSPRRQCLQLLDCVDHFVELGCGDMVANQALKLISLPEVKNEFYYLEHILKALIICQAGRPIEEALALDILKIMLDEKVKITINSIKIIDMALASIGDKANETLMRTLSLKEGFAAVLLESCIVLSQAQRGQYDTGMPSLNRLFELSWTLKENTQRKEALLRLIPIIGHFGRADIGSQVLMSVLKNLRDGVGTFSSRDQGDVLIACARACGKLGDQERAYTLLSDAIATFENIIGAKEGNNTSGYSALFEILVSIVDEAISLGDYERGSQLVERGVKSIESWLDKLSASTAVNSDHPFFVHQARIKSAIALLSLDKKQRGLELLQKSLDATAQVKSFDGKDRADLLVQALQALSLTDVSEVDRVKILDQIVNTGIGSEASNPYNDSFRRDIIRASIKEVVQKHTAYRLAIKKMRSLEERIIRTKITN
jgi:hypothetical protein